MSKYTFPFKTCEKKNDHGIAQPWSVLVNVIDCCIIGYFLVKTKHLPNFLLLLSIFVFEAFHTFSHVTHISGWIQTYIIHFLTYCMQASFLFLFYSFTKKWPSPPFILLLFVLVSFDLYALFSLPFIFYFTSQLVGFTTILLFYFRWLSKPTQKAIYFIFGILVLLVLFFLNEIYNCKKMLDWNPHLPYHILIEITGIVGFYYICKTFYNLTRS